jgi:hypothetical protein
MPDQPSWIHRLPDITQKLEASTAPFLDRPAIEKLFGLRRRQSIHLLRRMGGYQVGKTFLVDRQAVLDFLNDPERRHAAAQEAGRFRIVGAAIAEAQEELHMRRIRLPAHPRVFRLELEGLPAGIDLGSHELNIGFEHPRELLEKLFALAQALANDYERFEATWTAANRT